MKIDFVSPKNSVEKSNITICQVLHMAMSRKKVLLINRDINKSMSFNYQQNRNKFSALTKQ